MQLITKVTKWCKYDRTIMAPPLSRMVGIDQLRYVFAFWVLFQHGAGIPFFSGHADVPLLNFLEKFYSWTINGECAVMGFFIISGLCIHYPNIRREKFDIKSFYVARVFRLGLPLAACLLIAKLVNYNYEGGLLLAIIWTLYCEAIYYVVYPAVLWFVKKGWLIHLIISMSFISFVLIILWADDRTMYCHLIGDGGIFYWKIALLAFPCWLAGVLIAEDISFNASVNNILERNTALWKWRIAAVVLSMYIIPLYRVGLYIGIVEHPLIGILFSAQLNIMLFSLFAYFWIKREIIYANFGHAHPSKLLEKLGVASYSLYLVHILVIWAFAQIPQVYFLGYLASWILLIICIHIAMFICYIAIEKPSHGISKWTSAYLRNL